MGLRKFIPIILFIPCLYVLICLSLSREQSNHAVVGIKNGVYAPMYPYLEKALAFLPLKTASFLCQSDLQRIHTGLGRIWYEKGKKENSDTTGCFEAMTQSLAHYKKATQLHPHDILAVRGIAETTAALEFSFSDIFPGKENKYNAFPFFNRVMAVEPNGFESNYAIARYLHKKGMKKELYLQIAHTAKIYPSYDRIKREPFFLPATIPAVKEGFHKAIKDNIMPWTAYFSLSAIAEAEKEFSKSASYYKKGISSQKVDPSVRNYLKLGMLLLKSNNKKRAYSEFLSALKKRSPITTELRRIYSCFKQQKDFDGFVEFAIFAEKNEIRSDRLKIHLARAQIEKKQYTLAKETLRKINANHPNAEAYSMLAELAKKEKDWDTMELSIQKATVLDPGNGQYLNVLADSLIYQRKYESAAEYMEKAVSNDPGNQRFQSKLKTIKSKIN